MILFDKKKLLLNSSSLNMAKYVVSGVGSKAMYSYDGVEWSEAILPAEVTGTSVCYGKNMFIITCVEKQIFYSEDGKTWGSAALPSIAGSAVYTDSCYGNGVFVAITMKGSNCLYSLDGKNWSKTGLSDDVNWRNVCYADDKFVAIGNNSSNVATIAYSYDGIVWNKASSTISGMSTSILPICYGNGVFVTKNSGGAKPFYSTDLSSWTQSSLSVSGACLCYGNNVFVCASKWGSYYSYDGVVWNKGNTLSYGGATYAKTCCYDGESFWLVDRGGPIMLSQDGISWEQGATLPSDFSTQSIACYTKE